MIQRLTHRLRQKLVMMETLLTVTVAIKIVKLNLTGHVLTSKLKNQFVLMFIVEIASYQQIP